MRRVRNLYCLLLCVALDGLAHGRPGSVCHAVSRLTPRRPLRAPGSVGWLTVPRSQGAHGPARRTCCEEGRGRRRSQCHGPGPPWCAWRRGLRRSGHGQGVRVAAVADAGLEAGGVGVKGLDKGGRHGAACVVLGRAHPAGDLGEGSGGERLGGVDKDRALGEGLVSARVDAHPGGRRRGRPRRGRRRRHPCFSVSATGLALQRLELLGQRGERVAEGCGGAATPP